MAIYLGKRKQGDLILFRSAKIPTQESHGQRFTAVIGPFRSKVGASFFARYGRNNPHIRTVEDAERLARADLRMEQAIVEESMTDEELTTARECEAQDQFKFQPPIQQGTIPCRITLNINV
jgi:hypothetical protein